MKINENKWYQFPDHYIYGVVAISETIGVVTLKDPKTKTISLIATNFGIVCFIDDFADFKNDLKKILGIDLDKIVQDLSNSFNILIDSISHKLLPE